MVAGKLEKGWSTEQISWWLRRTYPERPGWHVTHKMIYRTLYNAENPVCTNIDKEATHWDSRCEGDTTVGRHTCSPIGTIVERRSRLVCLVHLPRTYRRRVRRRGHSRAPRSRSLHG